ncbi:phasin family protein [Novosphingobium colocasiae]
MQGLGTEIVSESRSAFETMTGDIKELAAAKSPTDFFKLQGDLMRKNFDSAVAYGSKSSETMLKLASDVIAPPFRAASAWRWKKARTISV